MSNPDIRRFYLTLACQVLGDKSDVDDLIKAAEAFEKYVEEPKKGDSEEKEEEPGSKVVEFTPLYEVQDEDPDDSA